MESVLQLMVIFMIIKPIRIPVQSHLDCIFLDWVTSWANVNDDITQAAPPAPTHPPPSPQRSASLSSVSPATVISPCLFLSFNAFSMALEFGRKKS